MKVIIKNDQDYLLVSVLTESAGFIVLGAVDVGAVVERSVPPPATTTFGDEIHQTLLSKTFDIIFQCQLWRIATQLLKFKKTGRGEFKFLLLWGHHKLRKPTLDQY